MRKLHCGLLLAALIFAILPVAGCGGNGDLTAVTGTESVTWTGTSTGAADTTTGDSYSFAVCGDNRDVGIESGVMGRIIDSARSRGAEFVVNTGDVTGDGSREELFYYQDYTNASGIRFYTVPGNHDVGSGGVSQDYEEIIGPFYYSFDRGADHFVILDNADDKTGIDGEQMQWYIADLNAGRNRRNTFIFTHIPVADPGLPSSHATGEKGNAGLESGKVMVAEALKHPDVRAFFFGHIHAYLSYRLDSRDAYVTGGAGAPLYFPKEAGGYYHYLLVTVRGEDVRVEVVRV